MIHLISPARTEDTAMTTTKRIQYDCVNKDYDAYLGGEYIGSFKTKAAAEAELDRLAFERLKRAS